MKNKVLKSLLENTHCYEMVMRAIERGELLTPEYNLLRGVYGRGFAEEVDYLFRIMKIKVSKGE